mgnify:CR=1 FL=1
MFQNLSGFTHGHPTDRMVSLLPPFPASTVAVCRLMFVTVLHLAYLVQAVGKNRSVHRIYARGRG